MADQQVVRPVEMMPHVIPSFAEFLFQYRLQCERDAIEVLAERAREHSPEAADWLLAQIAGHPSAERADPGPTQDGSE